MMNDKQIWNLLQWANIIDCAQASFLETTHTGIIMMNIEEIWNMLLWPSVIDCVFGLKCCPETTHKISRFPTFNKLFYASFSLRNPLHQLAISGYQNMRATFWWPQDITYRLQQVISYKLANIMHRWENNATNILNKMCDLIKRRLTTTRFCGVVRHDCDELPSYHETIKFVLFPMRPWHIVT